MEASPFNRAYRRTLASGRLTLGVMTPMSRRTGALADVDLERALAARADRLGVSALWARDVPLMVPQGSDGEAAPLDDPFLWLAALGEVTETISLGLAAAVLPLRHPLHLAKSALSLNRMTHERFILGLGSGDREAEFAAFGHDIARRAEEFRQQWATLRAALAPAAERGELLAATGGYDVTLVPAERIAMLVVGSARQSLQWVASHAEGWATYHREEERQKGRIGLWQTALRERGHDHKPFVQSLQLDLLEDADAKSEPLELGMRVGRRALVDYLLRLEAGGVDSVILNLVRGGRPAADVLDEIGTEILPALEASAATSPR
ncbi:LLM class oxidoreductase [soil metagenome]